jgi:hypothetical protein
MWKGSCTESASNPYEDVVLVYIGLVRQDSPQAASAIEQINSTVGAQAALYAALIMTIFRMELKQNIPIPDMSVYTYLIRDYPEAVLLLEYAIGCCLQAWGIQYLDLLDLKIGDPANSEVKAPTQHRVISGNDKQMESRSDVYNDVVATYIHVLKQDSSDAAAAIEEILSSSGSHAALRATLVITLLKMEVQKKNSVENITSETHLIKAFPEALPLLEQAIACWIQAWSVSHAVPLGLTNGNHTSAKEEATPSTPKLPIV